MKRNFKMNKAVLSVLLLAICAGVLIGTLFILNNFLSNNPMYGDVEIPIIYALAILIAGKRSTVILEVAIISSIFLLFSVLILFKSWIKCGKEDDISLQKKEEVTDEDNSSI